MSQGYSSWGNLPDQPPARVECDDWRLHALPVTAAGETLLAYGNGRSYGDVCLNGKGIILDTSRLDRWISFDREQGTLRVEAGLQLGEILDITVPAGWFLPVVPGTRFVTVGGAVANDIHGKNHHLRGTFGNHVEQLELLVSSGERLICSRQQNPELFAATIGGMGLTGLIVWVEIKLVAVTSNCIEFEQLPFQSVDEFVEISKRSSNWEYSVAWLDCLPHGKQSGRGIFSRGKHSDAGQQKKTPAEFLQMPFTPPISLVNPLSLRGFNEFYFHFNKRKTGLQSSHYRPYFFPLDNVQQWNRIYGSAGFYQYQCVVPEAGDIKQLLTAINTARSGSFLAVLKLFGESRSPGYLSFPRAGLTLALDFPNRGTATLALLNSLDKIVMEAGGTVYPAKDARMSPAAFKAYYPQAEQFIEHIDTKFSSSFWRRVHA